VSNIFLSPLLTHLLISIYGTKSLSDTSGVFVYTFKGKDRYEIKIEVNGIGISNGKRYVRRSKSPEK
jgi:hypothetical protein